MKKPPYHHVFRFLACRWVLFVCHPMIMISVLHSTWKVVVLRCFPTGNKKYIIYLVILSSLRLLGDAADTIICRHFWLTRRTNSTRSQASHLINLRPFLDSSIIVKLLTTLMFCHACWNNIYHNFIISFTKRPWARRLEYKMLSQSIILSISNITYVLVERNPSSWSQEQTAYMSSRVETVETTRLESWYSFSSSCHAVNKSTNKCRQTRD